MTQRSNRILQCIQEAQEIREAVDKLSRLQDKATLHMMGLTDTESCSVESSSSESGEDDLSDTNTSSEQAHPDHSHMYDTLLGVLRGSVCRC